MSWILERQPWAVPFTGEEPVVAARRAQVFADTSWPDRLALAIGWALDGTWAARVWGALNLAGVVVFGWFWLAEPFGPVPSRDLALALLGSGLALVSMIEGSRTIYYGWDRVEWERVPDVVWLDEEDEIEDGEDRT